MKVLLTGANGYVGLRLLPALLEAGHEVVCLVRNRRRFPEGYFEDKGVTVYEGDLLKAESLVDLPSDIEAAYYLVHSMGSGGEAFVELERQSAENFLEAVESREVGQVVYLSGIVPDDDELSAHLGSRLAVEEILKGGRVPVTVLRAPIVVGSGSASFEIIRDLVEKLPVMVAPKWLKTKCQPIAIRNVIGYLLGVLGKEEARGEVFEIGGEEVLTYREMLDGYARVRELKRFIFLVPVMTPRLSSYWLFFVTRTSYPLAKALVDSMRHDVVCGENRIRELVPQTLLSYEESIEKAFAKIAQNRVPSAWFDSLSSGSFAARHLEQIQAPEHGVVNDARHFTVVGDEEDCRKRFWQIGGKVGWYSCDWLWKFRGRIDRLVGGTGIRRGRRDPLKLLPGDALDFWRVLVADEEEGRLLLYAEMKLPGEAWLEWKIKDGELVQTATFRPSGLLGRLYWLAMLPFHAVIFHRMGVAIAGGAE